MDKPEIICSGCSYTWGQGLWSYLDTNEFIPNYWEYISGEYIIPEEGERLREKLRWPHIVGSHFGFKEIVKPHNGGSDDQSIEFIKSLFSESPYGYFLCENGKCPTHPTNADLYPEQKKPLKLKNCKWIILQTTQLYRSPFEFEYKGDKYRLVSTPSLRNLDRLEMVIKEDQPYKILPNFDIFYEWLIDNDHSFESFKKRHAKHMTKRIEETLKKYNDLGINVAILSWTDEYLDTIKKSEFLSSKFIDLEYNGKTYECIEKMQEDNTHLFLNVDPSVKHDTRGDEHPSKECHEVIAQNVIRYIENYE
jgi:hypothetical protein